MCGWGRDAISNRSERERRPGTQPRSVWKTGNPHRNAHSAGSGGSFLTSAPDDQIATIATSEADTAADEATSTANITSSASEDEPTATHNTLKLPVSGDNNPLHNRLENRHRRRNRGWGLLLGFFLVQFYFILSYFFFFLHVLRSFFAPVPFHDRRTASFRMSVLHLVLLFSFCRHYCLVNTSCVTLGVV